MMSVTAVETFYGLLALVGMAVIAVVVIVRLLAALSDGGRRRWEGLVHAVAPNAYAMAWVVAFLATAGSLYFSEVAGFEPCRLCWYQRIAMYPLVILLGVAAARRERAGSFYVIAMALIGALVSTYHVALEWFPSLDSGACSATTPCTLIWFRVFGFISLPTLALTAFALILALMAVRLAAGSGDIAEPEDTDDVAATSDRPSDAPDIDPARRHA
jgi:disulfide bond formation protein DsbB